MSQCIIRHYTVQFRDDYNGRPYVYISRNGTRLLVLHHVYSDGNHYGRTREIYELDENWALLEQRKIWCYDNYLDAVLEEWDSLPVDKSSHHTYTLKFYLRVARGEDPKTRVGYLFEGDTYYAIKRANLTSWKPLDYSNWIENCYSKSPTCEPKIDALTELEERHFESSQPLTLTAMAYSDPKKGVWIHVHEHCQKLD
jgi:hypothetical protein